jgi:hypothetical protein
MSARRLPALIVLALLGLLLVAAIERVAERGRFVRPFSSYGSGPEGTRAFYLLLGELGFSTVRWSQDLARLPRGATLLALGSCARGLSRPISRYEHADLLRWIERGGVLIVAGARNYVPRELGVGFSDDSECAAHRVTADEDDTDTEDEADSSKGEQSAKPAADGGRPAPDAGEPAPIASAPAADEHGTLWGVPMGAPLEGLPIVPFHDAGRFELERPAEVETLLGVPPAAGAQSTELVPLAIVVQRGQGRVIALAGASLLQNRELADSEGAPLLTRILQRYANTGPLIFDEYHLGLGERRSLMQYLRQSGALPAVLQLLVIVVVALVRAGARFGAVQVPAEPKPGGTVSFVTALGRLYGKADDRAAAVRLIARAGIARIARHHGIRHLQPDALERELATRAAPRAVAAVQTIVSAMSTGGRPGESLPGVVTRIDAAVADALAEGTSA